METKFKKGDILICTKSILTYIKIGTIVKIDGYDKQYHFTHLNGPYKGHKDWHFKNSAEASFKIASKAEQVLYLD